MAKTMEKCEKKKRNRMIKNRFIKWRKKGARIVRVPSADDVGKIVCAGCRRVRWMAETERAAVGRARARRGRSNLSRWEKMTRGWRGRENGEKNRMENCGEEGRRE